MTATPISGAAVRQQDAAEMAAPIRATIIVVSYNSGHALMKCISSLYQDGARGDVEVILVDNASRDGSVLRVVEAFPEVRLILNDENLGFGGANNLGARNAWGEFLAFLNPDTIVEPGWLDALIRALETNPDAGLATSTILMLREPDRINTAGNDVHLTGLTLCRGLGQPADSLNEGADIAAVSGAAFVIRRDLFRELDGFDPRYFMYFEDTDLSLRARLAGWRCLAVPDSIVYHDYELTFGPLKTYYEERNRYLTLLKVYKWRTLLLLLPTLLLAEVITWGFVLLRDRRRWRNKMRATIDVLRDWPDLIVERKKAQAARRVTDRELLALAGRRLAFEQLGEGLAVKGARLIFNPLFRAYGWVITRVLPW